ncbi:unnamed protein product [Rotaria sordida]|uniref:Uncharacterized protein n=1 Tax=Rotaria sordida TaxID=392033 RepID=A0A814STQ8_9BILA|nr:unnamed protein product [Rotaria sordida]
MHVSDAIIGLLLSLIFCNCENDLSSVDTTAFIASRISIDLSPSNVTNLNETEPTLNNTDTSNWIEIVTTTATSTENVTTTSTTTVIITSTSARINETAHSKTPSVMNTTSTPPQNTVKPTTPSAKPNLGLILGLSLGLGLPFLIDKGTAPSRTIETVRNNQFHSFRNQSSPNTRLSTLRDIDTSTDYLREAPTIFFENMPGVVQFIYYEVIDEGASATVDVQGNEAKQ